MGLRLDMSASFTAWDEEWLCPSTCQDILPDYDVIQIPIRGANGMSGKLLPIFEYAPCYQLRIKEKRSMS